MSNVVLGGLPLTVSRSDSPGNLVFAWETVAGATYELYRGDLGVLRTGGTYNHACLASSLASSPADIPGGGPGNAYFLVSARTVAFGEGSLGTNSAGAPRPNTSPCP